MLNSAERLASCQCEIPGQCTSNGQALTTQQEGVLGRTGKTAKSLPPTIVSLCIAFFPKCPICWAAYMSLFGGIGLAKLPYMSWLLPVFTGILVLHLLMLSRQLFRKRYLPFVISVLGAGLLLAGRSLFPLRSEFLFLGIGLLVVGSLLNTFPFSAFTFIKTK